MFLLITDSLIWIALLISLLIVVVLGRNPQQWVGAHTLAGFAQPLLTPPLCYKRLPLKEMDVVIKGVYNLYLPFL